MSDVICHLNQSAAKTCRLSIRMFAAMTFTGCLIIKTLYMIITNVRARRRINTECLTFEDIIVASALDTDLQLRNECLINADEDNRYRYNHTCHRHCRGLASTTGDGINHCQKCAKFNVVDKAANLFHPSMAIKCKKSLLSNLGSSAVSQMVILMICFISMFALSIWLAVLAGTAAEAFKVYCYYNTKGRATGSYKVD